MDRLQHYRVLVRVVEAGSFTKAATTLDIPRSTVSTVIAALEVRLGTRLFNRTTRKVSPTQDGLAFYERCLRLLADSEELDGMFRSDATQPSGKLHVDLPGRIGRLIVAPALPEFLARYPGIDLQLGVTDRAVDLIGENVDCALRVGELPDSGLIARSLGVLPLINVASPAYLARHGTPQVPADLEKGHLAVRYASPSTGRPEAWEWLEEGTIRSRMLPARVTVNSAEGYIACCLAGLGLIQIPAFDVQDHIRAGDLIEVLPDHRCAPMPIHLVYPHRRHLSPRVQLFASWLAAQLAPHLAAA
ncbi:MAG: LysR family transcriptional regulator [Hyphomonas sp.]